MKTSVAYLTMLCCYVYYIDDSEKQNNDDVQHIQTYAYESGSPVGMNVTTTTGSSSNPTVKTAQYYFVKNLQGDIVAMADATGAIKCSYTYNSWGKVLSIAGPNGTPSLTDHTNPANINPFRYRGYYYYYDGINEIYWLQSRFYDPSTGRFLNADGYVSTGQGLLSTNMFLYCLNDPIQFVDDSGGRCVENGADSDWVMVTPSGRVVTNKNISRRTKAAKTFSSADEAAKDFSKNYYSKSTFTHLEYGTEIYEHKVNGKIVYSYNPPRAGEAHAVEVGLPVPNGSRFVAYAHIHPTTNDFTPQDINLANRLHKDAYVIGPNQNLIGYNNQFNKRRDLGYVRVKELTDNQRAVLWAEYGGVWDEHADICSACNELR